MTLVRPFHRECLSGSPCEACLSEAERCRHDRESITSYLKRVARYVQLIESAS